MVGGGGGGGGGGWGGWGCPVVGWEMAEFPGVRVGLGYFRYYDSAGQVGR